MKKLEKRKNFIARGDSFDIAFANYFFGENKKINNFFNEKKHRLDSNNVSYRVITHWENMGLLTSERNEGTGWRKYSILDIVWVHIISELRNFGFSIDKILTVKDSLSFGKDYISPFPELEFYVAFTVNKVPSFLAVFSNGESIPCTLEEFQSAKMLGLMGNCILISINEIMQKIFSKKDLKADYTSTYRLDKDEIQLLAALRLNNWTEINIKGKDGKIEMIESTSYLDANNKEENRIIDLINSGEYQNIQLKTGEGKVLSLKRTIKQKLK